ncbi:MAG TPA: zinc ribbon domain-containing protein [Pirellulales bacterium]|nr:zinc ribbon domain-containing protein [Pirellulales bacterium]
MTLAALSELPTDAALSTAQSRTPRTHRCEACGAPLDALDRFCQACGAPHKTAALAAPPAAAQKRFRCEGCGAETLIPADTRSFTCPFCDSNYVIELPEQAVHRQPPEFVIGFAVAPDDALLIFRRWLANGNWFRPGDLTQARAEEKLRGVYLPFWSFSMLAASAWSARIGEYWYRTETYTAVENGKTVTKTRTVQETEWWNLSGRHQEYYSGYLVSASRGLPQADAQRIGPFQLAALKRYQPAFLAGWSSEEYSVERDAALAICQQEFARREERGVAAFLPGDTHSGLHVETSFSQVNSDLVLLPVYVLSYRYHDRLFRFLLNGQTGHCTGDKPISARRIAAVVVAAIVAVAVVVGALLVAGAH